MCPINGRRPYVEIYEVAQRELVREAAAGEDSKYKGIVQQVYANYLPSVLPERYRKQSAFITTKVDYTTGTVTVGSATSLIKGASTSWTSSNSDDFLIKVSGYDELYRVTFSADTLLTSKDSLVWTKSSGSGLGYSLFQNRYQLPSDFAYMAKDNPASPNIVYVFINGSPVYLNPWTNEEYDRNMTASVGTVHAYTVKWVSSTPYIYLAANPENADNIGFSYIPNLTTMRELTTGTAQVTGASNTSLLLTISGSASVTASLDTSRNLYFRNDADGTGSASIWAKISSITDGTTCTLSSTQSISITSGSSLTYSISEISGWQERFDDTILYKTAWIADPDGVQSQKWANLLAESITLDLTVESKRKRGWALKHFSGRRK